MPSPFLRTQQNRSRQSDADRPVAIAPIPEEYEGDNIPYRGVVNHGVAVDESWRNTSEDMPVDPDGRLVDVYDAEETAPDPIPVYIVNRSSSERRAFRVVIAYAGQQPATVVGQDDSRSKVTIRNTNVGATVYIAERPESANVAFGWPLTEGQTYVSESQEAIYVYADSAVPLPVLAAVEFRRSLDG